MRKFILASALALVSLCAMAQDVTVEHQYPAFGSIALADYVEASIVPTDGYSATITCDQRIQDYIIAYVKDGVLTVSVDLKAMPSDVRKLFKAGAGASGKDSDGISGPKVEICLPSLTSLSVDGSSTVGSESVISGNNMSFTLKKTASVSGLTVKAAGLYLDLSQKASADMTADVKSLNVQATNSAKASLKVPGAQRVKVNAGSFATVEIFGSADSVSLEAVSNSTVTFEKSSL